MEFQQIIDRSFTPKPLTLTTSLLSLSNSMVSFYTPPKHSTTIANVARSSIYPGVDIAMSEIVNK